jgi:large subunit ribosomal protein L35
VSDIISIQEVVMPKIKTHKSTAKRFRYSGGGKLMRMRGGGQGGKGYMLRRSKRSKRKAARMSHVETPGSIKRVQKLAPYLKKN